MLLHKFLLYQEQDLVLNLQSDAATHPDSENAPYWFGHLISRSQS